MQPSAMQEADADGSRRRQFVFDLKARLLGVGGSDVWIDRCDARQEAFRKRRRNAGKNRSARLPKRERGYAIFRPVSLQRVRSCAQRDALEVEPITCAENRLSICRRVGNSDPRSDIARVGLDRIGQELQVVSNTRIDHQIHSGPPFVLDKPTRIRICLKQTRLTERLLKCDIDSRREIRQRRECVSSLNRAWKADLYTVVEKISAKSKHVRATNRGQIVSELVEIEVASRGR